MLNSAVDQYIEKAAPFAQPILVQFRKIIHENGIGIVEELKWGMPCFVYKKKIVANMAAFKQHAAVGFWYEQLLTDQHNVLGAKDGMGSLGKLTAVDQLPTNEILAAYIHQSMVLIDSGTKLPKARKNNQPIEIPEVILQTLKDQPKAKEYFETLSPSHKKEYIDWIIGAKQEATVIRRLEKMIENLNQRKTKEWKYAK